MGNFSKLPIQLPGFLLGLTLWLIQWTFHLAQNLFYSIIPPFEKDVKDDVILVTGGASGIGRLMAQKFADLGPKMIVVWDLNTAENEVTKKYIESKGVKAAAFTVNLADVDQAHKAAADTKAAVKKALGDSAYVTMLINNAGIVTGKKMLDCPDKLMKLTMDVNATAHFWTLKDFLPDMIYHNKGHVVTVASGAGLVGCAGLVDYCASKFAAVGLTESIAFEVDQLQKNINVTVVCPYFINTGMFKGVTTKYPWLLPILEPEDMVDRIVTGIRGNEYMILYPRMLYPLLLLKDYMPMRSFLAIARFTGVNKAMDDFVGRAKSQ